MKITQFCHNHFWKIVFGVLIVKIILILMGKIMGDDPSLWYNIVTKMPHMLPYINTSDFILGATEYPIVWIYFLMVLMPLKYFGFSIFLKCFGLIQIAFAFGIVYLLDKMLMKKHRIILGFVIAPTFLVLAPSRFDLMPGFFVLLAVYLISKGKNIMSSFSLALAALLKVYPVMLAVSFLRNKQLNYTKILFYFAIFILLLNIPLIFHSSAALFPISNPTQEYRVESFFGALDLVGYHVPLSTSLIINRILLVCLVAFAFLRAKTTLGRFIALTVPLLITSNIFSPQWNLWFLPLLILSHINITKIIIYEVITIIEFPLVWTYLRNLTHFNSTIAVNHSLTYIFLFLIALRYALYIYFYFKAIYSKDFLNPYLEKSIIKVLD